MKDSEFLSWIWQRMVNVHGEQSNVDYMLRLNGIILAMKDSDAESDISFEQPKPRTKTEFVKCEFASDKEKAEAFIEGGLRYFTHGPVTGDKEKDTIPVTRLDELLCGNGIYRKVETEIDERQEFIERWAIEIKNVGTMTYKEILGRMYDDLHSG
ncbi:putative coil containing protein [Vibrio phage 381E49-1]|nr:putative coil containing protein [Vibrio phage 381E49-1]